ncbi:MAG TPA: hypothetical protein VI913_00925 [Candidatus Peribacteraceae bacterium]|nr:hypothetical protein [Candidatus Peribacteraceae bacterium]
MRALAIFFAAIMLLGYGWFRPHQDAVSYVGLVGGAFLLIAMALTPRAALKSAFARWTFLLVGIIGAATQVPMMWRDYFLINGADYGAMILRLFICGVFLGMGIMEFRAKTKRSMGSDSIDPEECLRYTAA